MAASHSPAVFILTKCNSSTNKSGSYTTPTQLLQYSTCICTHVFRKNEIISLYNSPVFKMATLSVYCEVRTGYSYVYVVYSQPQCHARSEALVCGRSLAGIVGSNPPRRMYVCLLCRQIEVSASGLSPTRWSPTECEHESHYEQVMVRNRVGGPRSQNVI